MTVLVERATLADARAIAEIHVEAWRVAYAGLLAPEFLAAMSVEEREAMWRETLERGTTQVLVARGEDGVCGWISFGGCRDDDAPADRAELWAIYVAPRAWRSNVGRSLWLQARERLRAEGFASCSLWVFERNASAIRFYRSLGFAHDGLPAKQFELGGREISEVRYVIALGGP